MYLVIVVDVVVAALEAGVFVRLCCSRVIVGMTIAVCCFPMVVSLDRTGVLCIVRVQVV